MRGRVSREREIVVTHEGRYRYRRGIYQRTDLVPGKLVALASGSDHIAAQQQFRGTVTNTRRGNFLWLVGDLHMRNHRTIFLRQAGEIQRGTAFFFQVRRHAQQCGNREHPASADTGHEDIQRFRQLRPWCCGQIPAGAVDGRSQCIQLRLLQLTTFNADKAGAEAIRATHILIAAGLIDLALAPVLGFQRLHRDTAGLHTAITTTFTDAMVDQQAFGRIDHLPFLTAAAFFRGTNLLVDNCRDTGSIAQLALDRVEVVTGMNFEPGRQFIAVVAPEVRVLADQTHPAHPFRQQLARQRRHGDFTIRGLTTGHGDSIVEQDLVGDIDLGSHGLTDREQTRVVVGAVTHVLENVLVTGETVQAHPVRALAAHVGIGIGTQPLAQCHDVAADTGTAGTAFGQLGGGIVRTAGAENRFTCQQTIGLGHDVAAELFRQWYQALCQLRVRQPAGDGFCHLVRAKTPDCRQQVAALQVFLAHHTRTFAFRPAVEKVLHLVFHQRTLLFHHQNTLHAARKLAHAAGLQRPGHRNLMDGNASLLQVLFAQVQQF